MINLIGEFEDRIFSKENKLKDALQDAITGLEWEVENYPEKDHKADEEKIQEWKQLLQIK